MSLIYSFSFFYCLYQITLRYQNDAVEFIQLSELAEGSVKKTGEAIEWNYAEMEEEYQKNEEEEENE